MRSAPPPNRPASNPSPTSTAGDNEGCCAFHVNQKRGRRLSTARAFLKPALHRANLRLETGCLVEGVRVRRQARRRRALAAKRRKRERRAAAAKSILAAGSIGSTQILLLSGIGPAAHLREHGIAVVLDRPGVGANLQDHLQLRLIYKVDGIATLNERYHSPLGFARMLAEYALLRRGPLTMAPSQLGLFTRSDPDQERANLQYHVQPLSLDRFGEPLHKFPAFTASVCNLRPTSRGAVRLRSRDPADAPVDQAELPVDRPGPPHRRQLDPPDPAHRGAAGARAVPSRRISAGRRGAR